MAKARGLAAATEDSRALSQNWPNSATDMIGMFEDLLNMGFPVTTSAEERRAALTAEYTRLLTAVLPELVVLLQEIDATITVVIPDRDLTREVQMGRAFQDWDPARPEASGPAFNLPASSSAGANASGFPNYSDDFVFFIWHPLLAAAPVTEAYLLARKKIDLLMNEAMPAWCDSVTFATGSGVSGDPCGFILDTDRLDLTVFCA